MMVCQGIWWLAEAGELTGVGKCRPMGINYSDPGEVSAGVLPHCGMTADQKKRSSMVSTIKK